MAALARPGRAPARSTTGGRRSRQRGRGERADEGLRVAAEHGDEIGQCRALNMGGSRRGRRRKRRRGRGLAARARPCRAPATRGRVVPHARLRRAAAALFGPTPVPEAIELCHAAQGTADAREPGGPGARSGCLLEAMAGNVAEARRLVKASEETLLGLGGLYGAAGQGEALVELLDDRPQAAEAVLRPACERWAEMGDRGLLASSAAMLAQALYAQSRYADADEAGWSEAAASGG